MKEAFNKNRVENQVTKLLLSLTFVTFMNIRFITKKPQALKRMSEQLLTFSVWTTIGVKSSQRVFYSGK